MKTVIKLVNYIAIVVVSCYSIATHAKAPPGVYEDAKNDAGAIDGEPVRIRLVSNSELEMGRAGGVWGEIGDTDQSDYFFLGKTPDLSNLQFTLVKKNANASFKATIIERNSGQEKRIPLGSASESGNPLWVSLKGEIFIEISSLSSSPSTLYSLMIWYPGGSIDSMTIAEINDALSGDYDTRPKLFDVGPGGEQ